MSSKRSHHELKRIIEAAVAEVSRFPRSGLWFGVDKVEAQGRPLRHLRVWATLHFLPTGAPFCCAEPMCHLCLFGDRIKQAGDLIRRARGLRHDVTVEFMEIEANVHAGVKFKVFDSAHPQDEFMAPDASGPT